MEIAIPKRDTKSVPEFLIARSFDINKPGTKIENLNGGVLAGILKKGTIKVGDELEIKPGITKKVANQTSYHPIKTKVTSIFRGQHSIKEATPGGSLAFETELDNTLSKTDSLSGNIASKPGSLPDISETLKIKYELFDEILGEETNSKIEQLKPSELIMLSINTTTTVGKIEKMTKDEIQLSLRIPAIPIKGDSVGLARNINGHWRLIGFGEIL